MKVRIHRLGSISAYYYALILIVLSFFYDYWFYLILLELIGLKEINFI
jgi:hypothetical protein